MYTYVKDTNDIENFLREVSYFHDALVKELSCAGRGFVDKNLLMYDDLNPSDCRLVIQQQSDQSPCTEIIFENISKLVFEPSVILEPELVFEKSRIVFSFTSSRRSVIPQIVADSMKYRILGKDVLGRNLLYTNPIPVGDACPPKVLKDHWVECTKCGEVWEYAALERANIQCGKCGAVYTLENQRT
ncbi:hypothetical protein BTA51_02160 [Hahella sp. CCB-MM4]|uniref:hypothetical protein n=1 Tax=Hahella sp. (strain CCB-MM4) TaxID=1926491 RepID=UPI000B9C4E1A|nr:hypothetical protein [Hahella sp. CCB-MM4]OZG75210.1 hypothetical protein BTA51_02160 [Hahella sp. CCB-MM4]